MKRKKILHLITGLDIGGAEMMLLKVLPLLESFFQNEVCCIMGHGPVGKQLEEKGIPVIYLGLQPSNALVTPFRLGKILRDFKPDMLVTYLIHADLLGRIVGRVCGIKYIICNQRGFYLNWKFLRAIDRYTTSLVNAYIVQTQYAKKELMRILGLKEEKFTVIPNGIDLRTFQFPMDLGAKKRALQIPTDHLNIVCVSNLKPGKGYEELLEAFEIAYKSYEHINLLIVGSGNEKKKYLAQISSYSSKNNIFFLGRRDEVGVREILRISDIFVLATHSEGMSNAILEAMASKLAIITTNIPVHEEIFIHTISALLVPVKNPQVLADTMKLVIANKDIRIQLGQHAYEDVVKRFEINAVIQDIRNEYEHVLYGR